MEYRGDSEFSKTVLGCELSVGVGKDASMDEDCAYGVVEERRKVKVPFGPLLSLRALWKVSLIFCVVMVAQKCLMSCHDP